MMPCSPTALVFFWTAVLVACGLDLRFRRIPNWLCVLILLGGLTQRGLEHGVAAAALGAAGAMCGLAFLYLPFARGWVGGGDVKLLAAMGAWLGPQATVEVTLCGVAAGGLLSLYYALRAPRATRQAIWTNLRTSLYTRAVPDAVVRAPFECPPYSLALVAGVALVWLYHGGSHALG